MIVAATTASAFSSVFSLGTAVGAALGALLAPKSGAELWADLREAAKPSMEAFRKATGQASKPEGEAEPQRDA